MADAIAESERAVIDAALAAGRVTVCPPRTFSAPAGHVVPLRERGPVNRRIAARAAKFARAREAEEARARAARPPAPRPSSRDALSDAELRDMARRLTAAQIAAQARLHVKTVRQRLAALGLRAQQPPRAAPPRRRPRIADADLLAALDAGRTFEDVAADIGQSPDTLRNRVRKLRGSLRPASPRHAPPRPRAAASRLSDTDLRAALAAGRSDADIAAAHGLAPQTVARRRRALGVRRVNGPPPAISDAVLRALVAEGLSVPDIAARTGCSARAVRRRADRLGLLPRPGARTAAEIFEGVDLQALARVCTVRQIAEHVGCNRKTAARALAALGLQAIPGRHDVPEGEFRGMAAWLTAAQIAEATGMELKAVYRRLRRLGIKARPAR